MADSNFVQKTSDFFKKNALGRLIVAVVTLILGIFTLLNPAIPLEGYVLFLAVALLLIGAVYILASFSGLKNSESKGAAMVSIVFGVVVIVLALVIFASKATIAKYLPVFYGFTLMLGGISVAYNAFRQKAINTLWKVNLAVGVVVAVLGVFILANPGFAGKTLGIWFGLGLALRGAAGILEFVKTK